MTTVVMNRVINDDDSVSIRVYSDTQVSLGVNDYRERIHKVHHGENYVLTVAGMSALTSTVQEFIESNPQIGDSVKERNEAFRELMRMANTDNVMRERHGKGPSSSILIGLHSGIWELSFNEITPMSDLSMGGTGSRYVRDLIRANEVIEYWNLNKEQDLPHLVRTAIHVDSQSDGYCYDELNLSSTGKQLSYETTYKD